MGVTANMECQIWVVAWFLVSRLNCMMFMGISNCELTDPYMDTRQPQFVILVAIITRLKY